MMGLIKYLKKVALFILLLYATDAFGQTQKIHTLQVIDGTTTETMTTDALIQLDSKKKGLLLPRVALTDAKKPAPLAAHTAGMTVYNTATVSSTATIEGVNPGYYYNDGTKWVRLAKENEAWALTGNVGTNSATNFIGTTDNQPLVFRTNDKPRMHLTKDKGWLGIGFGNVLGPLDISSMDWLANKTDTKKDGIILEVGPRANILGDSKVSITSTRRHVLKKYRAHSIDFGLSSSQTQTDPFISFGLAPKEGFPSKDEDMTIERMRITSEGKVGIGTTAPKGTLDVRGSVVARTNTDDASSTIINYDGGIEMFRKNVASSPETMGYIDFKTESTRDADVRLRVAKDATTQDRVFTIENSSNGIITDASTKNIPLFVNLTQEKVGIGTTSPKAKLDVNGNVKIKDGTQGAGKVLTSDAVGNAHWETPNVKISLVDTKLGAGVTINKDNRNQWLDTGTTITLPPGKWLVTGNLVFSASVVSGTASVDGGAWLRSTFCDSPTAENCSADIVSNSQWISGGLVWKVPFGVMVGSMVIHNKTAANKVYYFKTSGNVVLPDNIAIIKFGGTNNVENIIKGERLDD